MGEWKRFNEWLKRNYSRSYAANVRCYAKRFGYLLFGGNIAELNRLPLSKRAKGDVLRALSVLSKYVGCYDEFTRMRKACGLTWERYDSFKSFLRMAKQDNKNDVVGWVKKCIGSFDSSYATFVKFVCLTGLRLGEAINSFNLLVRLSKRGRLSEYFNGDLCCIEHFRYPEMFIRGKKNVFLSFVPKGVVDEVCRCRSVSDSGLKRRIAKHRLRRRFKDLRDYYATFMLYQGLLREEIDLLQGRIGKTLFMKHYFSPSLKTLRDKTLTAINSMISNFSS
jgi:hypothetical protein